jgi:hypothetical protein
MRIALGVFLALHGIAHLVGFVRSWAPTRTTIIGDRIDLGAGGIKLVGVAWALIWLAFMFAAVGTIAGFPGWEAVAIAVTAVSLVLCLLQLPDTKLGVAIDIALLALLFAGQRPGWYAW